MIPIYLNEKNSFLPKEGTYYVVARNGVFIHKRAGLFHSITRVDDVAILEDLEESYGLHAPPIPKVIVHNVKYFFEEVYKKHQAEATVNLFYNKDTKDFLQYVPKQKVGGTYVSYSRDAISILGYLCVGTIHSHCNFEAFHSEVDIRDEQYFDGLHIVMGNNLDEEFSIKASFVTNGVRWELDPLQIMEGIEKVGDRFRLINVDKKPDLTDWVQGITHDE